MGACEDTFAFLCSSDSDFNFKSRRARELGFGLIKGQFFKYRKEKRKEKSLRGRGGGLRRSGGAPGADLACKRHRHVQSWLLESPNFL